MKKRIVIAIVLATILATGSAFAVQDGLGIGLFGGSSYGWGWGSGSVGGGGALTLKLPKLPVYWGINLDWWGSGMWLGVSADFWHIVDNKPIADTLYWFMRGGLYGKFLFGTSKMWMDFGARLPIGLSWQPIKEVEIFFDIVPSIGVGIYNSAGIGGGVAGELGFRLWL